MIPSARYADTHCQFICIRHLLGYIADFLLLFTITYDIFGCIVFTLGQYYVDTIVGMQGAKLSKKQWGSNYENYYCEILYIGILEYLWGGN